MAEPHSLKLKKKKEIKHRRWKTSENYKIYRGEVSIENRQKKYYLKWVYLILKIEFGVEFYQFNKGES